MKNLKEAKIGETVRVVKIHGEGAIKRRIMDMGLTKGVEVYIRKVAPLGDPIEVTVRGYELSLRKAAAVWAALPQKETAAVIGSDTVVYIDGEILGKPHGREEAVSMISRLSGRSHTVCTGVTVITAEETRTFHETTEVHFYPLSPQEVEWYCSLKEPYDKAGAYGIQAAGALLVQGLTGDYFNVMGLPVAALARHLREMGVTAALSEQNE